MLIALGHYIRSGNGKFFGFGDSNVPIFDQMEGRFAQILPPKIPDDKMRLLVKTMLEVKGITPIKPGAIGRQPGYRS